MRAHSMHLALASDGLETAISLAKAQAAEGELLRLPLPCSSEREAALLICAVYARQLDTLLDSLPAARLMELADVCHRIDCEILEACGSALVRKVQQGAWLTPQNALSMLSWAQSKDLAGLRLKTVKYAASHMAELVIDEAAANAGDNVALLLLCLQGKT